MRPKTATATQAPVTAAPAPSPVPEAGPQLAKARAAIAANDFDGAFLALTDVVDDAFKYSRVASDVLPTLRTAAKGRRELRGQEFAAAGSYNKDPRAGRCVFASAPFTSEQNQALAYQFAGDARVYVRCYLKEALQPHREDGARPYVRISINQLVGSGAPANVITENGHDALEASFELPLPDLRADDFALMDAEAGVEKLTGYKWQGDKQVPTYSVKRLSGLGMFLWERVAPPSE